MEDIIYKPCASEEEISSILKLQNENHYSTLSNEEMAAEGFLTCKHSLKLLIELNRVAPHIIAVSNDKVIAYLLTMTAKAEASMPSLKHMFQEFKTITYNNKAITDSNYLIVGQVCVGKGYRGVGVLNNCYELYINQHQKKYDFAITEIATRNKRSLNAHLKIGFKEIHKYYSPEGEEWSIVILDWKQKKG